VRGARQSFRTTPSLLSDLLIVRAVGLEYELPQAVLCSGISDGAEQEKTASLPVGRELAREERDVLARSILRAQMANPISRRPSSSPPVK